MALVSGSATVAISATGTYAFSGTGMALVYADAMDPVLTAAQVLSYLSTTGASTATLVSGLVLLPNQLAQIASYINANISATGGGGGSTSYGTYAARPTASSAGSGARYAASDGMDYVSDGTVWHPIINGVVGGEGFPSATTTGWTSTGAVLPTITCAAGAVQLVRAATGSLSLGFLEHSKSASQSITAFVQQPVSGGYAGISVRDSSSTKSISWVFNTGSSGNLTVQNNSNFTTFSAGTSTTLQPNAVANGLWLRIADDGTALRFSWSLDGVIFTLQFSDTTTFLGSGDRGNLFGLVQNGQSGPVQTVYKSVLIV